MENNDLYEITEFNISGFTARSSKDKTIWDITGFSSLAKVDEDKICLEVAKKDVCDLIILLHRIETQIK